MNKHFGKRSREVSGILMHGMGRYIRHDGKEYFAKDWLDFLKVSAHYYIDIDGTIIKGVEPDKRAFHAGASEWKGERDLNQSFIGVEFLIKGAYNYDLLLKKMVDVDNPPYTSKQYKAGAELCRELMKQYPAITMDRILRHSEVSRPDVRPDPKHDPGPTFDMERLKNNIKADKGKFLI